jgi:hypothetical protein
MSNNKGAGLTYVSNAAIYNLLNVMYHLLNTIHANQLQTFGMLQQLQQEEAQMAIDLTSITAEVTNNTSVSNSVVTLLQNLTTIIQNIPQSTDPTTQAALDQLTALLTNNDSNVAAAVVANTPAATTTPPASGRQGGGR